MPETDPTAVEDIDEHGGVNHCLADTPFKPTVHLSDTKSTIEFSANGQDISVEVVNLESQSQIPWSEDNWQTPKMYGGAERALVASGNSFMGYSVAVSRGGSIRDDKRELQRFCGCDVWPSR